MPSCMILWWKYYENQLVALIVVVKGEYDFSDEKIRDKYDLKLDKAIAA